MSRRSRNFCVASFYCEWMQRGTLIVNSLRGRYFLSARLLRKAIVELINIENLYLCDGLLVCLCRTSISRDKDIRAKHIQCLAFRLRPPW